MSNCLLCRRFVGSASVTVVGTSLVVNIPAASYNNCTRICLGILQELPDTATINMPVVITIGTDTTEYPLVRCDGNPVTASDLSFRGLYRLKVQTSATSAVFRVLNGLYCSPSNNLAAIPVVAAGAATGAAAGGNTGGE